MIIEGYLSRGGLNKDPASTHPFFFCHQYSIQDYEARRNDITDISYDPLAIGHSFFNAISRRVSCVVRNCIVAFFLFCSVSGGCWKFWTLKRQTFVDAARFDRRTPFTLLRRLGVALSTLLDVFVADGDTLTQVVLLQ